MTGTDRASGKAQAASFRLRGRRADSATDEEIVCEAADIVEAVGIASRHFGSGDVELHCWRGRDYELRIHADKSWSLKPTYKL